LKVRLSRHCCRPGRLSRDTRHGQLAPPRGVGQIPHPAGLGKCCRAGSGVVVAVLAGALPGMAWRVFSVISTCTVACWPGSFRRISRPNATAFSQGWTADDDRVTGKGGEMVECAGAVPPGLAATVQWVLSTVADGPGPTSNVREA